MRSDRQQAFPPPLDVGQGSQALGAKPPGQLIGARGVGHGNQLRAMAGDLRSDEVNVFAGGEGLNTKTRRQRLDNAEALPSD